VKQRFSRRESFFVLFAAIAGLIMLAGFIAMNAAAARGLGRGGDFLAPWKGLRVLFFEKGEPYAGATVNFVQEQVYGRSAQPGEKPYILDIPLFLLILYFPAGVLSDPLFARAFFLFASEAALLVLLLASLRLADWQPRRLFTISLFVFSALSFYSLWALIEGSPAILLGLIYAGILLSLRAGSDETAGFLLALAFYRWEIGGAFLIFIMVWVISQGRWRVLSGLFMSLFVFIVAAFFVNPGWVIPYLRAILANARWDYGLSPAAALSGFWPQYGGPAGWVLSGVLWLILAAEWLSARKAEFRRVYWTACLSLAAAPLLGWRGELQNLVVLLIPLIFILAVARERWRAGYWLSGLLLLLIFTVPWALFVGNILPVNLKVPLIFLFLPVFTIIALYWTRWWAMHPARTWLERASISEYR
jgi:hypothetical protein